MTDSGCRVLVCVPLLDEGINFSELLDSDIELLNGPVVFAMFGQVLHEFEANWVKCRSSAREGGR